MEQENDTKLNDTVAVAVTEPEKKTPKARWKKALWTVAFIVFNVVAIAVVLYLEIRDEGESFVGAAAIGDVLQKNLAFFGLALLCYVIHILADTFCYFALIKQCGYGNRFSLALKIAVLGKYYDNITPWSTGGQPFQIGYLIKANVDAPTACTLPIIKYAIRIFFMDALVIVLFSAVRVDVSPVIITGAAIGMVCSTLLPLLLVVFSGNVPFLLKVTRGFIKLMTKLKLVKDYDKAVHKAQDQVDSFLAAFRYLGKHKYMIVIIGGLTLIDCVAMGSLPFLIIRALGGDAGFFTSLTQSYYTTFSSGVIPTPGASGAAEGSFYSVFAASVPEGMLFWAVLMWRAIVFYLPIFIGIITLVIDWIKGKKKGKVSLVTKELRWLNKKTINHMALEDISEQAERGDNND